MRIQKIAFVTVTLTIFLVSVISCKKNVNGCSDPTSDNYNFEDNTANGSCDYHGNLMFWYDSTTHDSLLANNISSVNILVDNESFQTIIPPFIIWSAEPECSTSIIENWITMTGIKTRTFSLHVEAKNGSAVVKQWDETMTIDANQCEVYKMIW